MNNWPHDNEAELIAFYGNPGDHILSHGWVMEHLVTVSVPWVMSYAGKPVTKVQIHRLCAKSLGVVFGKIWDECDHSDAKIQSIGMNLYGGSFNFRPVRGSTKMSCHAFGAALDFDPAHEGMGTRGHMSSIVIDAFKSEGWFWGGDFKSRPDPMHFQATTGA